MMMILPDRYCPVLFYDKLKSLQNSQNFNALKDLKYSLEDILKADFHVVDEHEKLKEALLTFGLNANIDYSWEDIETLIEKKPEYFSVDLQTSAYLYSLSKCNNALSTLYPDNLEKQEYLRKIYHRAFSANGMSDDIFVERPEPWSEIMSDLQVQAFSIAVCSFAVRMIGIACSDEMLIDLSIRHEKKWKRTLKDIMISCVFSGNAIIYV